MVSTYREWYETAGFTPAHQEAITAARQQFHAALGSDPETDSITGRIAVTVIIKFTKSNSLIEKWPESIRRAMNRRVAADSAVEFDTWARPRDLEKREQGVSLEAMGLTLPWSLKDILDAIRYCAEARRGKHVLPEVITDFFLDALMDPHPTPQTNPLLWWLGVLIQTEVLDNQPRWTLADLLDTLDFSQKVEAIDHYARVLVLETGFYEFLGKNRPHGATESEKDEVTNLLNAVPIFWIDRDAERPPVDARHEAQQASSTAWRMCVSHVESTLTYWTTDQAAGPMSTVIRLSQAQLHPPPGGKAYNVKAEICERFTTNPMVADCYPTVVATKATIKEANREARAFIRDELGSRREPEMWDEVFDADGKMRVRAIFLDEANNARVIAWVEETTSDSVDEDSDMD
ncbi:hypothetical protein BJX61DRAFT_540795 [Aspergillus egyptiacus]|nr:hypothetical protein BJX61DRAFT_540795 [Aspergillus egyptiacus]